MIKEIKNILKKEKGVLLAYLYGSFAKESYNKKSDIDIAILLKNPSVIEKNPFYETKLALKIEEKLKTKRNVDLRILNKASLRFVNQVLKYGKLIYFKDERFAKSFETMMLDNYLDFKPFLIEYDKIREQRLKT